MKTYRIYALAAIAALLSLLVTSACSDDASAYDATAPDTQRADGGAETSVDAPPAKAATVCGTIVDDAAAPLADFELQLCSELLCLTDRSDSAGQYCIRIENPATYVFHAIALATKAGSYGELLLPFTVTQGAIDGE